MMKSQRQKSPGRKRANDMSDVPEVKPPEPSPHPGGTDSSSLAGRDLHGNTEQLLASPQTTGAANPQPGRLEALRHGAAAFGHGVVEVAKVTNHIRDQVQGGFVRDHTGPFGEVMGALKMSPLDLARGLGDAARLASFGLQLPELSSEGTPTRLPLNLGSDQPGLLVPRSRHSATTETPAPPQDATNEDEEKKLQAQVYYPEVSTGVVPSGGTDDLAQAIEEQIRANTSSGPNP